MVGVPECRHRFASTHTIFSSLSIRRGYGLSERRNFGHFNFKKFIVHLGFAVFNQKREPFLCSNTGTKKSARSLTSGVARSVPTLMALPLISKRRVILVTGAERF
jgi:hypothetical protein